MNGLAEQNPNQSGINSSFVPTNANSISLANLGINPQNSNMSMDFLNPVKASLPNTDFLNSDTAFSIGSTDNSNLAGGSTGVGGGFDFSGAMNNFSLGAQGISGLASAYSAWQQTELMKEQLAFQKANANRNIHNNAVITNNALYNQADARSQLTTGAEYGTTAHIAERDRTVKTVDGTKL